MNEASPFEYKRETAASSGQPPPAALGSTYRFSPEELRVLQECNQESFFKRSLPLGTALGLGIFGAIQRGYLKPSPRFGPFPKVTLAVIAGYFLGKLSYQQACAEKLMALPGSYIGQLLRDRRDGKITNMVKQQPPSMFGASPNDIYSDAGPGSSLDLDTDRPVFSEDTYRPDAGTAPIAPAVPSQSALSYDEIRRKNRGEYSDARQAPYKVDPTTTPPAPQRTPAPSAAAHTNKYGDVME